MSNRNIHPDILFFPARRCLSIVCFNDFQDSFSPKTYGFGRSEFNINIKVVYSKNKLTELMTR
jgi:hypothetical protein